MSNNENFGTNEENKVSVNKTINNNENKPATSKESVIKKTIVKDTATPAPIKIKQKKVISAKIYHTIDLIFSILAFITFIIGFVYIVYNAYVPSTNGLVTNFINILLVGYYEHKRIVILSLILMACLIFNLSLTVAKSRKIRLLIISNAFILLLSVVMLLLIGLDFYVINYYINVSDVYFILIACVAFFTLLQLVYRVFIKARREIQQEEKSRWTKRVAVVLSLILVAVMSVFSATNGFLPKSGAVCSITRDGNGGKYAVLTAYYGRESDIVVPSTYRGYEIKEISSNAFKDCDALTSIVMPSSVTTIGYEAFYDCDSLTSVTIGDGVETIGSCAFTSCDSLTSVTIGNSVKSIGDCAFFECDSLTKVNYLGTIDEWAQIEFGSDYANPLYYAEKLYINDVLVTKANITTATKINSYAFCYCVSLTNVTIGDGVETIGSCAFTGCDSLTSVTIGNSVKSIGDDAFSFCDSLTSVTIGNSVKSIGDFAFYYCVSLTNVTIPNSVTSIGDYVFYSCDLLTGVTIPNSVTSIGDYAFRGCSSLTIYCESASQPSGWHSSWNYSHCPVVWGYNNTSK